MSAASLVRYQQAIAQLSELDRMDMRFDLQLQKAEEESVQTVVFAGMCVEATLHDLGACLFGDEFAERIERLDPLGKFAVLSQCTDRKTPPSSDPTYQSIRTLVMARNRLVHYKSKAIDSSDIGQMMTRSMKEHEKHLAGISASFRTLVLLSLYFDGTIFEELRILPSFLKPEYWKHAVPDVLHDEVYRCIQISRKNRGDVGEEPAA